MILYSTCRLRLFFISSQFLWSLPQYSYCPFKTLTPLPDFSSLYIHLFNISPRFHVASPTTKGLYMFMTKTYSPHPYPHHEEIPFSKSFCLLPRLCHLLIQFQLHCSHYSSSSIGADQTACIVMQDVLLNKWKNNWWKPHLRTKLPHIAQRTFFFLFAKTGDLSTASSLYMPLLPFAALFVT